MSHLPFLRVELLIFLKLQITIIYLEEYMLFVNYVLDLNNGLEQRLFRVVWTTTMKRTKLRTPSYWWAMMIKMSVESYIIEDSWVNNYNYESLLYFCVFILYSKMLWNGSIFLLLLLALDYFNALSVWKLFMHWQGSRSMCSQGQRWVQWQKNSSRKHHSPSHASTNNEPIFPWRMKKTW